MTEQEPVLYEFPCNERVRTFLRLEHTTEQMHRLVNMDEKLLELATFKTLFDIIELTSRPDLRKDLIQELVRYKMLLSSPGWSKHFNDDSRALLIMRIDTHIKTLVNTPPTLKGAQSLRENEWLSLLKSRGHIPGAGCSFDMPSLQFWLSKPYEERRRQFLYWIEGTSPIKHAVDLLLRSIRLVASERAYQVSDGNLMITIPPQENWSMIRIRVPRDIPCYPEITVNKFKLWIRFLELQGLEKAIPSHRNFSFNLEVCAL